MNTRFTHSPGYSMVSVLAALAILAPAITASVTTLHFLLQTDSTLRLAYGELYTALTSARALGKVMSDLDSHRLNILPRVHGGAKITFSDGTPNSVMSGPAARRPKVTSAAITGLRLNSSAVFDLKFCEIRENYLISKACLRFPTDWEPAEAKGYLGLNADEMFELQGEVRGQGSCRDFVLEPTKSMALLPLSAPLACPVLQLVPIEEEYTLYIDQLGNLRYLGHAGEKNLENQPVTSGLSNLTLQTLPLPEASVLTLSAELEFPSGRKKTLPFIHHLGRINHFNLAFNQ